MRKNKLLLLLVLLMMAATGAMAQVAITTNLADSYDAKVGIPITLSIEANNATGYQWYQVSSSEKEIIIEGATSSSYTFTPTEVGEYKFFCMAMGEANLYDLTKTTTVIAALPQTYSVTMAEGTEDAENWTVPAEAAEGSPVTATYNGAKKVKSVKAVKKGASGPLAVPLTIEAITAGSVNVLNPKAGMQYSLDGGATKNAVTTDEIVLNPGDKVAFYGNGTSITSYGGSSSSESTRITGNGTGFTCKVYGNIMSLVDEENFATAKTLSEAYAFSYLFHYNPSLTDASGLLLPATTLGDYCYDHMFYNCTSLTAAPALPATQLAASCYYYMFYKCGALTAAPELPATQLAENCYCYMFRDCTSLTAAPALPATQLAADCYNQMFRGCTALTTAPVLPAETLVDRCYYRMFYDCSKLAAVTCRATSGINSESSTTNWLQRAGSEVQGKTVYTVSTADWPSGNNGIPSGWERVDIDN